MDKERLTKPFHELVEAELASLGFASEAAFH
jgi:hypothetical protein